MENCREFGSMLTRTRGREGMKIHGITMTTGGFINVVGKQVLNSLVPELDLHLRDSLLEFSFNSGPSGEYPVV